MKSYEKLMDLNSYLLQEGFEEFCRRAYERISLACEILSIVNDETYEDFRERNYATLESDYLNSIEKTIH